jgi:hypothetical protein
VQIDPKAAEASLADIDVIVARLKQSTYYRGASTNIIIWGVLVALGYVANHFVPSQARTIWITVNGLGIIVSLILGLRLYRAGLHIAGRITMAMLLFFGFGLAWYQMGNFTIRGTGAFWPSLFMFGYALAGLWLGRVFTWLGVSVALLVLAGYLWVDTGYEIYLAIVDGGGLVLAGLWMRRA